jgi:hypothetical protein
MPARLLSLSDEGATVIVQYMQDRGAFLPGDQTQETNFSAIY